MAGCRGKLGLTMVRAKRRSLFKTSKRPGWVLLVGGGNPQVAKEDREARDESPHESHEIFHLRRLLVLSLKTAPWLAAGTWSQMADCQA